MSCEILFLRHGKAATPAGVDDFDRPLKPRGERQAQKVGAWLKANGVDLDAALSSPAKRAYDTAVLALDAAGQGSIQPVTDKRLYFDTLRNLLVALAEFDGKAERLLVVGHNPWIERMVLDLAHGTPAHPGGNWYMKTGALMHFAVSDFKAGLGRGQGRLLAHVLPDDLPNDLSHSAP